MNYRKANVGNSNRSCRSSPQASGSLGQADTFYGRSNDEELDVTLLDVENRSDGPRSSGKKRLEGGDRRSLGTRKRHVLGPCPHLFPLFVTSQTGFGPFESCDD